MLDNKKFCNFGWVDIAKSTVQKMNKELILSVYKDAFIRPCSRKIVYRNPLMRARLEIPTHEKNILGSICISKFFEIICRSIAPRQNSNKKNGRRTRPKERSSLSPEFPILRRFWIAVVRPLGRTKLRIPTNPTAIEYFPKSFSSSLCDVNATTLNCERKIVPCDIRP
jgi:hypothetical protein